MKKHLKLLILAVFLGFFQKGYADTFIVTSNADSGPGTLREAITLANANGTAVTDNINFNIADVTETGRTIALLSELPALSSSITIDGSTQPGTTLGLSSARIILYLDHYTPLPFTFFFINNARDVKIFGIFFYFFENPDAAGGLNYAIGTRNSQDITIGAPGKGNMFSAVRAAVTNDYWNYYNDAVKNVTIQSNVFGRGINNISFRGLIDLFNATNIKIGGGTPNEGNIFFGCRIQLFQPPASLVVPFAEIENNIFNFDGTNYYNDWNYVTLTGNGIGDRNVTGTVFKNNFMPFGLVGLSLIGHKAIVQGNKIGVWNDGITCTAIDPLSTYQCSNVIVGGEQPGEENILSGISNSDSKTNVIRNTFTPYKINLWSYNFPDKPSIKITQYENGLIRGIANPNAKIQLYNNFCSDWNVCARKEYRTTIYADNNGDWQFPYTAAMPNIVATATIADSVTSPFTEPFADHSNFVAKHPTCGKSNGSITGIVIKEGTHIKWYNSGTNELVGTDTNLVNVPAGTYSLYVFNGENGCPWSVPITLNDLQPPPVLNPYITNASCGQSNGAIVTYSFDYGSKWMNANNDSIGTGYFINNLLPGTYYLKLWINNDTSCNKTYGPYIISNNSGPTVSADNIQVNPATCNNSNGSIKNITTLGVTSIPFIQWLDSLNNPVGSELDLLNVPAGKYKLKFKDQSGCDTISTPYYTVGSIGAITIDTAGKFILPSSCTANTGYIQNIKVYGATGYQWTNTATGNSIGNNVLLSGIPPGNYQLTATNATGCFAVSPVITVPSASFSPITVTSSQVNNATCAENNGSIAITGFSTNSSSYTFKWVGKNSGQLISNNTTANGLGGGTYLLMATDANGCEKEIFSSTIQAFPKPSFDISGVRIENDKCSLNAGSISGIKINGLSGNNTAYTWKDESNAAISTTLSLQQVGAGNYYLVVTDAGSCTVQSNSFTIGNDDNAAILPLYENLIIPRFTSATITVKNPQNGSYYLYSDAAGNQLLQQNNSGNFITSPLAENKDYYIRFTTGNCNSALVPVKITVVDKSFFAIPSAFTPNNDGKNDKLNLKVIGYIDVEYFKIFNRNGEEVFSTKTINDGWNGVYKGQLQTSSVFVWIAKGKDLLGNAITDKGTFVLIR